MIIPKDRGVEIERYWETYKNEIENKKWFLGKVDDGFDDTYCDIFVKIEDDNVE